MACDDEITEIQTPTNITIDAAVTGITVEQVVTVITDASPDIITDVDDRFQIIEACLQGARGAQGEPGNIGEIQTTTIAPPLTTMVIDQSDILTVRSTKWIVNIEDYVNTKFQYFEISAIHNGSTVKDSLHARKGDKFLYEITTIVNGFFMDLVFTNNSSTDTVTVQAVKINVKL